MPRDRNGGRHIQEYRSLFERLVEVGRSVRVENIRHYGVCEALVIEKLLRDHRHGVGFGIADPTRECVPRQVMG